MYARAFCACLHTQCVHKQTMPSTLSRKDKFFQACQGVFRAEATCSAGFFTIVLEMWCLVCSHVCNAMLCHQEHPKLERIVVSLRCTLTDEVTQ